MCAVYILTQNKNIVKKIRLVTAMHRNGPLPQVPFKGNSGGAAVFLVNIL